MPSITIEWTYQTVKDIGYGEVDLECQIECQVTVDASGSPLKASITDFYAVWIDSDGGDHQCSYEPNRADEDLLLLEALERAERELSAGLKLTKEDLKDIEADKYLKAIKEDSND